MVSTSLTGFDPALDVDHVVVVEAAHHVRDRVGLADVREELVAEALALGRAAHQAGDVDELERGGHDLLRLDDLDQRVLARVHDRDDPHVRLDGAERVVGRLGLGRRERVEEGRLADVGKADDAAREAHANLLGKTALPPRGHGPVTRRLGDDNLHDLFGEARSRHIVWFRMYARARAISSIALCALCAAACPGMTQTNQKPAGPRLSHRVGMERSPARLVLEVDLRKKPVGPATLHTFNLSIEEKVNSIEQGSALVSARLVDVVGASGEPQLSDQLALALDDLKISFRRTDRGEILDLKIEGVRRPLDEPTVLAIVTTLFGAARGPCLPESEVALQDDWTVEADAEVVGVTTHQRHFYTLIGQQGSERQIREKGHIEGVGTNGRVRRTVSGETFSNETVNLQKGLVLSAEYEWSAHVEDEPGDSEKPGVGRTRVRVERGAAAQAQKR